MDDFDPDNLDRLEADVRAVERALARLDDGSYGKCESCGERLSEQHLQDEPTTRFCRAHLPLGIN